MSAVELGIVQETMMMPLAGRAYASKMKSPILVDNQAVQICNELNYNINKVAKVLGEMGVVAMAVRAVKMDTAISDFIFKHPEATIVNIGAGLDTSFSRVDNGTIQWFDIDLPDSIALRKKFLPEGERNKLIAKSMFDFTWMDDIGDISKGLFIQVPGVLPYFSEQDVKHFLITISKRLKGAELIFDSVTTIGMWAVFYGAIRRTGMKAAKLKWGLDNPKSIEKWSKHIKVVKADPFMLGVERNGNLQLPTRVFMDFNDLFKVSSLVTLKFV